MKGITIKLPEATLRRLRQEARASSRSIASLVRERIEAVPVQPSAHDLMGDLVGCLAGSGRSATNARRKFRRR